MEVLSVAVFLQIQQMRFRLEPSREAREFSRRSYDTMARHDDGNRISSIRCANRSRSARIPQLLRELRVASGFSERYGEQRFPYILLKAGASHIESHRELFSFSCEVFL